ncbi:MAG: hypothetical protein IM638_08740 [Bacteroidetes bacterium]|nr:hypothetical protein [Bacteroidota bacterium]
MNPTNILIRPAARGGKYLGPDAANSNKHSAAIVLFDASLQTIVAGGLTNTASPVEAGPATLMNPVARCNPFATDQNTVGITLSVNISEPTQFWLVAAGPLSYPDQAACTMTLITVLPDTAIGTPFYPEGIVVEIPGLCISNVNAVLSGSTLSAGATVTMMCGCKINPAPESPWPPTDFVVQLNTITKSNAHYVYQIPYNEAVVSTFSGSWPNQAPNDPIAQAWISAFEPKLGNAGHFRLTESNEMPQNLIIKKMFDYLQLAK